MLYVYMVLIRGIYGVVYSTIIIGMFRYIIIIIYEVPTELSGSTSEPAIGSGDTGRQKHYFDSCHIIKTWLYNIRLQAPKLAEKCEIKYWYACGADGRKVGWSVYGHVIAEFSKMDRFSKLWGFELGP